MGESSFRFKQFTVHQSQTAMKVCTDSCILGAFTHAPQAQRILDIGTGTGLLALMIAQNHPKAIIDAVELDADAFAQAKQNVADSPFASQIRVLKGAIQSFVGIPYDLIVSNPPFFTNHLKSPESQRNQALHTDTLSFDDLLQVVHRLLAPNGTFVVLLPLKEYQILQKKAEIYRLFPSQLLRVKQNPTGDIWRIVAYFGLEKTSIVMQDLVIKNDLQQYTEDFRLLLKDYYLIF